MTRKVLLVALIAFFCQLTTIPVSAIRAYKGSITVTQPDGSQLTIRMRGDEHRHFQTTEDGYLLKANAKGFITYATVNSNGELVESSIIAQNVNKRSRTEIQFLKTIDKSASLQVVQKAPQRSRMLTTVLDKPQKAYPLNGSPKALVILANFKDKSFVVSSPQTSFQNLVTQDGYSANGGTGSAKDYFMASSYGKFAPNFIVVGPVTLPQTLDYYGKNDASDQDTNPAQMIVDACAAANTAGLDFTQFDTDNDGYVDNVFVYYAGYNEAEGGPVNTIWPHRWSIASAGITTGITFNGKKIEDYSCTSELKGNSGSNMCGIGTFCHEFGHVLGLPDYYDTSGTQSNTLNEWDIMDYGAYSNGGNTPPIYSAYDRFFLGYLIPEQISSSSNLTLRPLYQGKTTVPNTIGQSFLFSATTHNLNRAAPSPNEFFIVEYRKKTGWDTYLPAEGMCIWHIDYNQTAWNNNDPNNYTGSSQTASSHMRVYLQPLSGQTSTPGTAFTTGSFIPITWSGTNINRALTGINKTTDNITFTLMEPTISKTGLVSGFSTIVGTASPVQTISVTGTNLIGSVDITLVDKTNFEIKLASASTWVKNLSIAPTSGSISETLQIRYNPTSAGSQMDQIAISGTSANTISVNLNGTSTVPYNSSAPTIIVGKIENLIQFSSIGLNAINTKTFNIKTTDIMSSLNLSVTGAYASMFTVSVGSLTKDAVNGTSGTNVTVSYNPTAVGIHSASLTISGGGLNPAKVITLQGEGI